MCLLVPSLYSSCEASLVTGIARPENLPYGGDIRSAPLYRVAD